MFESSLAPVAPSNLATAEFRSKKIRVSRRRKFFRVVAKHAFPRETAHELVVLTGKAERTVYDWLAGNSDAPGPVFLALLGHIARGELASD